MTPDTIRQYRYPEDLLSNNHEYSKSFVVFYISVMKDTYATRNKGDSSSLITPMTPVQSTMSEGKNAGKDPTTKGGLGVGLGGLFKGIAAGAIFAGLSTLFSSIPLTSRANKQLISAIALYTPNQLNVRHSAQWTETTAQTAGLIKQAVGGDADADTALQAILGGVVNAGAGGLGMASSIALQQLPSRIPFGQDIQGSISTSAGLSPNPKKEQMFENMNFITFQLEFLFSPRNMREAESVREIIHQFKYHMHPEYATIGEDNDMGGFLYRYPSEFDICYYYDEELNQNIHKHSTSILIDMDINYSPNGVYSVFPNGMPTQTKIVLTFRELILRTKESIDAEFKKPK